MTRFQVSLSLWSVTSCSCIDEIPEVAKTSLKFKDIFFINVKTTTPTKNASFKHAPLVYVTVWEDLHNTAQMFTQRKKAELFFSL